MAVFKRMHDHFSGTQKKKPKAPKITVFWAVFVTVVLLFSWFRILSPFLKTPPEILEPREDHSQDIAPEGSFTLIFSQRMDKRSVEKNLHFSPRVPYQTLWDGNVLQMKPEIPLETKVRYTLSVSNGMSNVFGIPIKKEYVFSYQKGPIAALKAIFPSDGHLGLQDKIILFFSQPMRRDHLLSLQPFVKGNWEWVSTDTLIFTPENRFAFSTEYHLLGRDSLQALDRSPILSDFRTVFFTDRLMLQSGQDFSSRRLDVHDPFSISFLQPLTLDNFRSGSELRDSLGRKVEDLVLSFADEKRTMLILSPGKKPWLYGETYHLILKDSLAGAEGNMTLGKEQEMIFRTKSFFSAVPEALFDEAEKTFAVHQDTLQLHLEEPVSEEDLKHALVFSPAIAFSIRSISARQVILEFPQFSQKGENINLFVANSLRAPDHDYFSSPLSFKLISFERSGRREEITAPSFFAASDVFYRYLDTSHDSDIHFTSKNVDRIQVEFCRLTADEILRQETKVRKRWLTFTPSNANCQNYQRVEASIPFLWGIPEVHTFSAAPFLTDDGFFFVRLSALTSDRKPELEPIEALFFRSPWAIVTKRGESALVFAVERSSQLPASDVQVKLYASNGTLLEHGRTNEEGVYFLKKTRLRYEFIVLEDRHRQGILNLFSRDGYEPKDYHVLFNEDETHYQYRFFLQEHGLASGQVKGVALLRELRQGSLVVPDIKDVVVALLNQEDGVMVSRQLPMDRFGTVTFDFRVEKQLLSGGARLSLCIGYFEGVCQGFNAWAIIDPAIHFPPPDDSTKAVDHQHTHLEIQEASITVNHVVPGIPVLLTAEREQIFFSRVVTPTSDSFTVPWKIEERMVPEVFFSIFQASSGQGAIYDLVRYPIHRDLMKIPPGTKPDEITSIPFALEKPMSIADSCLLCTWYPGRGTFVVTGATEAASRENGTQESELRPEEPQKVFVIPGIILDSTQAKDAHQWRYVVQADRAGHFDQQLLEPEDAAFLSVDAPAFFRRGDTPHLVVTVYNHSPTLLNANLQISGHGLDLNANASIFFGLPFGEEKRFKIPFTLSEGEKTENLSLNISLRSGLSFEEKKHLDLRLVEENVSSSGASSVWSFLKLTRASLEPPQPSEGSFRQTIIIAPSPIIFAFSSLEQVAASPVFRVHDSVVQHAILRQYQVLQKLFRQEEKGKNILDFQRLWSDDALVSARSARAFGILEEYGERTPEPFRTQLLDFLKSSLELSQKRPTEKDLEILKGLASLSAEGLSKANLWYQSRDQLSPPSLLLLLLSFEDFRDAGARDVSYKIEELIQMLRAKKTVVLDQAWISAGPTPQTSYSDFLLTSWYLEALVRQKSSRQELPSAIEWLIHNKEKEDYQSLRDQSAFLSGLGSYLRIFDEKISARSMTLMDEIGTEKVMTLHPRQPFQFFSFSRLQSSLDHQKILPLLLQASEPQALFVEIRNERLHNKSSGEGQHLAFLQIWNERESRGELRLYTPEPLSDVLITQSLPPGASMDQSQPEQTLRYLPSLKAGETIIPFDWKLTLPGTFRVPGSRAQVLDEPLRKAISNPLTIVVEP